MNLVSNKAKQYGITALKLLILTLCFLVIFRKIQNTEEAIFGRIAESLGHATAYLWILVPILVILNWSLEIQKWRILAGNVTPISFGEAAKQSLAALSASLWTPNRIGEYGAKAMFYPAEHRKKIMLLKLLGNSSQQCCTLVFGLTGIIFLSSYVILPLSLAKVALLLLTVFALLYLGYRYRRKNLVIKGLSIANVLKYYRGLSLGNNIKILVISALRYLVFGSLFLILLMEFDIGSDIPKAIAFICSVYLLSSVIPSFVLFDVAVKGSVAVWLASQVGFDVVVVLAVIFLMWFLNFVVPAIFGSYFVIRYKPSRR